MKFKPTLWKVIVSIVVIIIWYLFVFMNSQCFCKMMAACPSQFNIRDCPKVLVVDIMHFGCRCGYSCSCSIATPISDILIQLILLLLPGIIAYVIWSFIQKNKSINKKKIIWEP
jgi:hypothetical protein